MTTQNQQLTQQTAQTRTQTQAQTQAQKETGAMKQHKLTLAAEAARLKFVLDSTNVSETEKARLTAKLASIERLLY